MTYKYEKNYILIKKEFKLKKKDMMKRKKIKRML